MTLATPQRSNGHRGLLTLAALFAVFVAFAGGILLRPSGTAQALAPIGPTGNIGAIITSLPTGTIVVKKVGNEPGNGFTGVIQGVSDPSFSTGWGPISVGGADTTNGLIAAVGGTQYRVTENGPLGIGWTLVGYKELAVGVTSCPANNANGDYTHADTGSSTTLYGNELGHVRTVCVLNKYTLPPAVEQVPGHIIVRKVRNPNGAPADGTLFSGSISGPTDTTWGPIAINGQTAPIPVKGGSYTVAEDAAGLWFVSGYQVLASPTQLCSIDPAEYSMSQDNDISLSFDDGQTRVVCVMNIKRTLQVGWTLIVCKVVDDNGDGVDDGGLFKIDLSWKNQFQMTVDITAHESDGPKGKCEVVQPPFDILAKAQEQGFRPNGWNGDVAGYPMVQVDNGALVSGDTATVSSGPTHVITFHNKTQPRPRIGNITVTKKTLLNGVNVPADDGSWHITIKSAYCQVQQTKDTVQGNPVGIVSFTNLPLCNDYVVSEDVNSKPFYSPVGPSSVNGITPSANTKVEFVNQRIFILPCIFNCTPDETPTPTNTPETTTPTATSTPAIPGIPTDVVQGQKTPGPANTPIPPSTGTGVASLVGGHSMVATFGLLGLIVGMFAVGGAAFAMRKRS